MCRFWARQFSVDFRSTFAWHFLWLGPSGGHFLVPPRKWIRMRLKGALSAKPPPLRILPASKPTGFVRWPPGADPATNGTTVKIAFIFQNKSKLVGNFHKCERKCTLKVVISRTIGCFVESTPKHCYSNVKARREESRGGWCSAQRIQIVRLPVAIAP